MAWRVARSLNVLLAQINAAAPRRSKLSDGSIGDARHSSRLSDHNPDAGGVVRARDFTHDPTGGFDAHAFAERLRQSRDPRIKYVISNGRIFAGNAGPSPWVWRKYNGTNKHTKHAHVSVISGASADFETPWGAVTGSTLGSRIPPIPPADPGSSPAPEDDSMSAADVAELKKFIAGVLRTGNSVPNVSAALFGEHAYLQMTNPLTGATEPVITGLNTTYRYAVLGYLQAHKAAQAAGAPPVSAADLAQELAPLLIPAVTLALSEETGADVVQLERAAETALRRVLGSLDEEVDE